MTLSLTFAEYAEKIWFLPKTCDTCIFLKEDGVCFFDVTPTTRECDVNRYFLGRECEWYQ